MKRVVFALIFLVYWPGILSAQTTPTDPRAKVWRAGFDATATKHSPGTPFAVPVEFSQSLLKEVASAQNLQIEYVALSWVELLDEFRAGRIDIICNIADTPERRAYIDFSTSLLTLQGRLYHRKNGPAPTSLDQLNGLRIALLRNSPSGEYVRTRKLGVIPINADTLVDAARLLEENRADVMFSPDLVLDKTIREQAFTNVIRSSLELPDFGYKLHFGVAKNQPALLEQINEGLATLHKNGTYERHYEQWMGKFRPRPLRWGDIQPYVLPIVGLASIALGVFLWQRTLLRRVSSQAKALHENEERLRLVFEGSQDGFWDWEVQPGRILRSPRWAGMLGYTLAEIGHSRQAFIQLLHPDDRPMLEADYLAVANGKDQFNLEFRMKARSGEWKWILDRGKVIARDPVTKAPLRITGTHTDITARKVAEEQSVRLQNKMQETQKLESLGVLAGGIAHDFNNLLTVVLGNGSLARMESPEGSILRERLDQVVTSAQRAADLCRQLLAYAGHASYSIERVDLNELVPETMRLIERSVGPATKLELSLQENLPWIEADATQIRQVIMNLVINASESLLGNAGTVRISTSTTTITRSNPSAKPVERTEDLEQVCLRVADTGCGMSPEVVARIFDPFFSTKFTGRGLGLAAVQGIVRGHRGNLQVQSTPNQGSIFLLYLPVARSGSKSRAPRAATAAAVI
jgi:PAS domain S-box-containing protein